MPNNPNSDESLFAAMAQAEQQAKAAQEQRRAVEAALAQLQRAIQRMETMAADLAGTERTLKAGMEQAAKAAFDKQSQELVHKVEWQVRESVNRLDAAVHRATHRLMPWTWVLAAFLLGVAATSLYGYYRIEKPLENTWNAQAILYQEMKKVETAHTPAPAAPRTERHREVKPAPQPTQPQQP